MSGKVVRRGAMVVAVGTGLTGAALALAQDPQSAPQLTITVQAGKAPALSAPTVRPGPTELVFRKSGRGQRELLLMHLKPGTTVEQLRELNRRRFSPRQIDRVGKTLTTFVAQGSTAGRGYRTTVDLQPGTYLALDTTSERNGRNTAFQVAGQATGASLPAADATVDMRDYGFTPSRATIPRRGTLRVRNRGRELHFMLAFPTSSSRNASRLADGLRKGASERRIGRYIAGEPTEPVGLVSPGVENRTRLNLRKGDYVLVCFYGSPASKNKEHARLGMVRKIKTG